MDSQNTPNASWRDCSLPSGSTMSPEKPRTSGPSTRTGAGPILVHKDLYAYDRALTREIERAAASAAIPVQHAVYVVYGSDAGEFTRAGVRAALVAIPTRYTHSPFEAVHLDDVEAAAALIERFAKGT